MNCTICKSRIHTLVILTWFATALTGVAQDCERLWEEGLFGTPGPRFNPAALISWDDGSGSDLYAGRERWDGSTWSEFGGGFDGPVNAFLPMELDGQDVLIVAGDFQRAGGGFVDHIAAWDGSAWTRFASGFDREVHAMAIFDDGTGPKLFAGGQFTNSGGIEVNGVARWNGADWETLGDGLENGSARALHVFDDGSGPALYVGGTFEGADGIESPGLIRWDGIQWLAVSDGMTSGVQGAVYALESWNDGSGQALYVAGQFSQAGSEPANNVARWDGTRWQRLGPGVNARVNTLQAIDEGPRTSLYAGGQFDSSGGAQPSRIARWSGTDWITMSTGMNADVLAMTLHDAGDGPRLYAGGNFSRAGFSGATGVAAWDGVVWSPLGEGLGPDVTVLALASFNDGSGPALFASGEMPYAGAVMTNHVGRWTRDSGWAVLGPGFDAPALALLPSTRSGEPTLYAGGVFAQAGGMPANHVAAWSVSGWQSLGDGVDGTVHALAEFDDGRGTALYVAGEFVTAGRVPAARIARWDGSSWESVGTGLNGPAYALAVFDSGNGAELYAAGEFQFAGDTDALNIARWDGLTWSPADWGINGPIQALVVHDLGNGPTLFAGGTFSVAGRGSANNIAQWDGERWRPLTGGVSGGEAPSVRALLAINDARGPELIIAGAFSDPRRRSPYIIAWDGTLLRDQDFGTDAPVEALAVFNDGTGQAVFAGGQFFNSGFKRSRAIGRLACPPQPCRADFDRDGVLTLFDFLAYQVAFDLRRPEADFDGDARITLFDFLAFQSEFALGCL